jgi:RHS repeat-associated protein
MIDVHPPALRALITRMIDDTYDGLQRLSGAVESPGSSFAYSYDLTGNRTGVTVNGTPILTDTYDAADQVVGWTYDNAGNLTNDGTTSYSYDATNDLTGTTTTGQSRAYTYNGDGTLVSQTANGTTTNYTQDLAGNLTQILAGTVGLTTTDYLYAEDIAPLAATTGGSRTWYGTDGQGSVRQSLNDTGTVLGVQNYDPFGQVEAGSALTGPFGYTGELQDATTGQEYLRARWYQPGNGQLLGVDPAINDTAVPYAYGGDSPVVESDPLGLCSGPQNSNWSWGRLVFAATDTLCNLGDAKNAIVGTATTVVAPPCDLAGGGCRIPTGPEVVAQLGQTATATEQAVVRTALDEGMEIRPNCLPILQSCRLDTLGEAQRNAYSILTGAYGAVNTLTFGLETDLGTYAGIPDLSCMPVFQQGLRMAIAGSVLYGGYGGVRAIGALGEAGAVAAPLEELPAGNAPTAASGTDAAQSAMTDIAPTEEEVSLFKAPQRGLGANQFAEGYRPADFPGNGAYFARQLRLAGIFARHYGEGVIETHIPASVYQEQFFQYEMEFLDDADLTELAIPSEKLDLLSSFPRTWHEHYWNDEP